MIRWALFAVAVACGAGSWLALAGREWMLPAPLGGLRLVQPAALGLLGALPWLLAFPHASRLGACLRAACWASLVLALCRPELQDRAARVSLVAAIDVSASIDDRALRRTRAELDALRRSTDAGALRVITFARDARALASQDAPARHAIAGGDADADRATDLQAALQLAYRLFEAGRVPNLLLWSDGNETSGDAAAEAERAARRGIRIDHRLVQPATEPGNVAVRALELPRDLALGVPFKLRAVVSAERATAATLSLYVDSEPTRLEQTRELALPAGETTLEIETVAPSAGRVDYRATLQPKASDRWLEDNQASVAADIPGPPRILLLDSEPQLAATAARALRERDFEVEVRGPAAAPATEEEFGQYAFVIVSDVPAQLLQPDTWTALRRYVEVHGGGLLVSGSQAGLGGFPGSTLDQLLPVRSSSEERRDEASLALALIIDCSGSMAGGKLELAREAASLTVQTLADTDLIEVIGFSSQPERRVRLQAAGNRASIDQSIERLAASGGTQLYPAVDAAYRDLRAAQARLKHAILLTDGQTQEAGIEDLASGMRADGITLSTVGLGTEVNRPLLEALAGLGGGRAYFPQDARNVPQIFMSEASRHKRPSGVDRSTRVYERDRAGFVEGVSIGSAPALAGYVTTQQKPGPTQVLLETERGEPLLARWRVGLGPVLAWTSDLKPRWAREFLRWPSFGRWFAQLVREHMRVGDLTRIPLDVQLERGRVRVIADVYGAEDQFENGLEAELRMTSRSGAVITAALPQTAPARYEADVPLPGLGAFTLQAAFRRSGRQIAVGDGRVAQPYAAEYAFAEPNPAYLAEISARTGGRRLTRATDAWDPGARHVMVRELWWPLFVWTALACFLLEQSVRRGRVFGKNPAPGRDGGTRSVW